MTIIYEYRHMCDYCGVRSELSYDMDDLPDGWVTLEVISAISHWAWPHNLHFCCEAHKDAMPEPKHYHVLNGKEYPVMYSRHAAP